MHPNDIANLLRQTPGRYDRQPSIADAAKRLFESLGPGGSSSTQAILRLAAMEPAKQHFPTKESLRSLILAKRTALVTSSLSYSTGSSQTQ